MSNETSFDEWWKEFLVCSPTFSDGVGAKSFPYVARRAYEAGAKSENEACAKVAEDRQKRCEELSASPTYDHEEREGFEGLAWYLSVIARKIRNRQKDKSC